MCLHLHNSDSQALKSLHSCFRVRIPFEQSARRGSRQGPGNHLFALLTAVSRELYETDHYVNRLKCLCLEQQFPKSYGTNLSVGHFQCYELNSSFETEL